MAQTCRLLSAAFHAARQNLSATTRRSLRADSRLGLSFEATAAISEPIDDLEQRAAGKYTNEEAKLRKAQACAHRLSELLGWTQNIYNHFSSRTTDKTLLLNPTIQWHEITASSLLRVDYGGKIVDTGSTNFSYEPTGITLHSAVQEARPDVNAVIHLHTPEVMGLVSANMEWIPMFQEAAMIGKVGWHEFEGTLTDNCEKDRLQKSLADNDVVLLKNHGFVACGQDMAEAFVRAHDVIYCAKPMMHMAGIPQSKWNKPTDEATKRSIETKKEGETTYDIKWNPNELTWQSYMRALDKLGMKTGYEYKLKLWRE